jgi:hypothetical protein
MMPRLLVNILLLRDRHDIAEQLPRLEMQAGKEIRRWSQEVNSLPHSRDNVSILRSTQPRYGGRRAGVSGMIRHRLEKGREKALNQSLQLLARALRSFAER